jgi:hypothetical protein
VASLGSTPGIIVGVGVGTAAAAALEPVIELAKQEAWTKHANRVLDPSLVARLVAQGGISLASAKADALREGYGPDKVEALTYLEQTVPGAAEALRLWRRGQIEKPDVIHAFVKAGLDARYLDPLWSLRYERLDPAVIANAIVRGLMDAPFDLPVPPPTEVGNVPAFPKSSLNTTEEALASGIDLDRLFVMTAIDGRPMGPEGAANGVFRGILKRADFDRAISEGDVRNEWADAIFETTRQIPTPHEYVELKLRGWTDEAGMVAGAARHGMTAEDAHRLELVQGRPINFHQVFIGERRGGVYDGPIDQIEPAFLKSLQESNLRPEWYNLAWAQRYSYPSAFVLRALTQSGEISEAEVHDVLLKLGWEPTFAQTVSQAWARGGGSSTKALTKAELLAEYEGGYTSEAEYRTALEALGYTGAALEGEVNLGNARQAKAYRDRVVKAIHDAYLAHEIDEGTVTAELAEAGVTAEAATRLLNLWALERRVRVTTLTAPQLVKAYAKGILTQGEALTRLEDLGYTADDASTLLSE